MGRSRVWGEPGASGLGGRLRFPQSVSSTRRILCVFPVYTPSFGTFSHAYGLMHDVRAFMPPQGLLLIAAYMPESWPVRFVDENITPATEADIAWADVILVSGMHVQAGQIRDIARRARAAGKVTALGGPSVSSAPEMYPEFDYLHIGELGDGTDRLIARLDAGCAPPPEQVRFETKERLPLADFPIPAYDLVPLPRYLMCTLQFSSGCPFPVRVLRHPQPLWPAAALQDAGTGHRRTRRDVRAARPSADRLFRR